MVRPFICFYNTDIYSDNRYGHFRVYGESEVMITYIRKRECAFDLESGCRLITIHLNNSCSILGEWV